MFFMASATAPVLSLTTLVEFPTVDIDGTRYKLLPADAMTLRDRITLEATEKNLLTLINAGTGTDDDEREISALLDQNCRQVLQAPEEVHARLTDPHRLLIVQAFIGLPRASSRQPVEVAASTASLRKSSGATSSLGSRGSTRSVRRSGSKRRSASFARTPR
jgi:hypothetical protein